MLRVPKAIAKPASIIATMNDRLPALEDSAIVRPALSESSTVAIETEIALSCRAM